MKQKDLVFLLGFTTIIVVVWIILGVYHESVTSTIPPSLSIQIMPIAKDFDRKTIEKLKTREVIVGDYEVPIATQSTKTTVLPGGTTNP